MISFHILTNLLNILQNSLFLYMDLQFQLVHAHIYIYIYTASNLQGQVTHSSIFLDKLKIIVAESRNMNNFSVTHFLTLALLVTGLFCLSFNSYLIAFRKFCHCCTCLFTISINA